MGQSSSTRRKNGHAEKKTMTENEKDNERPHNAGDVKIKDNRMSSSPERENGNETGILHGTDEHGCLPGQRTDTESRKNINRHTKIKEEFRFQDIHSQTSETTLADITYETPSNNSQSPQKQRKMSEEKLKQESAEASLQRREFWEEQIDIKQSKTTDKEKIERHKCDTCLSLHMFPENIEKGFYLCTMCERYLCQKCFEGHEDHDVVKYNDDKDKNNQSIDTFIDNMLAEGVNRERLLRVEEISVCDRINVMHPLDEFESCITGICGLGKRRWVSCDFHNNSIKVYEIESNTLIRYIRFISDVWDVTEVIHPDYQTTNTDTANESDDRTSGHETCALAVSLPRKRQVLILGMDDNPVCKIGSIKTPDSCYDVDYLDGQLFIYCPGSIYVMTVRGDTLKKIPVGAMRYLCFCVAPGRIYLTDNDADRVILINFNGDLISSKKIQHMRPSDVTVNDHGEVYVSSAKYNSIYKLDKNLINSQTPFDKTSLKHPFTILWYRDKLYVFHTFGGLNDRPLTVIQFT